MTDPERLLDACVDICLRAGGVIMHIYESDFEHRSKEDSSPVTEADEAAERLILAALAEAAPDIPVVAEESVAAGRVPETGDSFFLVDPLDGTKEFISRNGEFTVNIGLIENSVPVLGVVYAPAIGAIYAGAQGLGARAGTIGADGEITWRVIAARDCPADGLVVVASRSHLTDETKAYIDRFTVRDMTSAGSSLKFGKVACGEADLYPRMGRTMEWDTAAGDAVLRAAGGRVVTPDGEPLRYGKRNQATDTDFANPWFIADSGKLPS